ncbi:MAG: hypothetical protein J0L81_11195 [Caulobacterales bacterium]|nr:hypothetical protein [Caulobacterales bacterium]
MRRALVFVVLAVSVFAAPSYAQQAQDLSGVWLGREVEEPRVSDGYFRAELTQDDDGVLRGTGVVDPCPRCAGFMEYDLSWEGRLKGDTLMLTGTPTRVRGRHTVVRFVGRAAGDGFEGVLSGLPRGHGMAMVVARASDVTETERTESR